MKNEINCAKALLEGRGVSVLDAARLVCNMLDMLPENSSLTSIQFCSKIIEVGKRHIRIAEMSIAEGFVLYLNSKSHLRKDSFRDIRYLGNRLLKSNPELAARNFSELTAYECEEWIASTFLKPVQFKQSANEISPKAKDPKGKNKPKARLDASQDAPERARATSQTAHEVSACQFNKARTMLHGLFEFAFRRQWCDKNVIKLIEKRKVIEKEILPLTLSETRKLLKTAQLPQNRDCMAAVGILALAGIRPSEVRRLKWGDIDLSENVITVRSLCSKTGGVRQVENCPALKNLLLNSRLQKLRLSEKFSEFNRELCPTNFKRKWKIIRDISGFNGAWVPDVLRHTFASYHAKHFKDLPRLQLNMGHRDQALLRSRYVNMSGISSIDARAFFN